MKKIDVGIIIGRFQVPRLHSGHTAIMSHSLKNCTRTLVFLGVSSRKNTRNYPMEYEPRRQMLNSYSNLIEVYPIADHKSDIEWSKNLDAAIAAMVGTNQSVVLFGGRDSFIPNYRGKYKTEELPINVDESGTEVRELCAKIVSNTDNFRAGIIHAAYNRYPQVFMTTDVAIFNEDYSELLLGKKDSDGGQYRFVGGFVEPNGSLESNAAREVREETGLNITKPEYLRSFLVNDWRYQNEQDRIMTTLFTAKKMFGSEYPNDDLDELRWFSRADILAGNIPLVNEHWELMGAVYNFILEQKNAN